MIQTFTPDLNFTAKPKENETADAFVPFAEPSSQTIQNILNFSRNLETRISEQVGFIEVLKS